mmetsp:Transcript_68161/g.120314  ORF Transcript_68161/g.120314 Transcript_68161/m.120314 type:complete len:257 (-) Transcript_68161:1180-1950(-)
MGHGDAQLGGELLSNLLCVVGTIEVFAVDGALGACHVTTDDEVSGSVVLADDHVLDSLARACHLHAVRQVGPSEHWVLLLSLLAQGLVSADAHNTIDVAWLSGATGGVDKQHAILDILLGANQQLKVSPVDRVAVLESHHILALWQRGSHFSRSCSRIFHLGELQAMDAATNVILADLLHQTLHSRVLQAGCAIAFLGLHDLVWLVYGGSLQNSHFFSCPLQQDLVTLLDTIHRIHVQGHGHTKELLLWKTHVCDN